MINIRLKPEEFPFKVIKRLLIWFVTPEVWQNMLNAKMQLAPHYSHQRHVPLPCCLSTPHSTATLQTCQMKTFTNYVQPSQLQRLIMSVSLPPILHTEVFAPHGTMEHQNEGWLTFCGALKQTKHVQYGIWNRQMITTEKEQGQYILDIST